MASATTTGGGSDEDNNQLTREEQIDALSDDFSKYLEVNANKEVNAFSGSIEEMLTQLDEYCGLVDIIRSDSSLCLNRTLPEIYKKSKEMEKIFDKIDKLEAYVMMVKKTVSEMEKDMDRAESEMGSLSTFKKVLGSFSLPGLFSSSKNQPAKQTPTSSTPFIPPEIFSTDSFISYGSDNTESSPMEETHPQTPAADNLLKHSNETKSQEVACELDSDTDRKDSGISVTTSSSQETNSPVSEEGASGGLKSTSTETETAATHTDKIDN